MTPPQPDREPDPRPGRAPSTRRRPTHRKGRPTLSRESIARAALARIERLGHEKLTMRDLARDLGVTARALYDHVSGRDDVLVLAALQVEADWAVPELHAGRWQDSLRDLCRDLRAWYRRHPNVLATARNENLTTEVHPQVLRNNDAIVGFFLATGMSPQQAFEAWSLTLLTVAGFVELHDSWHDRPPAHIDPETWDTVPGQVLDQHAGLDIPHWRTVAASVTPVPPDHLFNRAVDLLIAGFTHYLRHDPPPRPAGPHAER